MIYRSYFKRLIDIIISGLLLMILSPLLVIVTIGLKFYNGNSGVFFLQKRPGKNEKIFNLIKFKTMNDKKNESGELLPSMLRITPLGAFVRKYSLDELPQLFNVLKGDMSLIGPRPLLVQYLSLYTPTQKRRHELRPGITGWAQVNGRNAISWNKKFELDIYYLENLSFRLDIFILWKTFLKVIKGSDVNSSSNQVVETFNGNN
jgi:undecaprenyl phosphate N,N'-diacetylbacillosamine 1-phosphate transferase